MQASSLLRTFLTMSFNVAIMAGRFRLVRSEVSIRIPSEIASEGAAIALGRFAGFVEATGSGVGGPRNVSSKPIVTFFFPPERADDAVVLLASFRALRIVSAEALVAREFPLEGAGRFADATTAFEAGFAVPLSGLGGASNAAALARNRSQPASLPPPLRSEEHMSEL